MPDEKFDEKDREKREEKSPQEKSWEEKYRRDPVSSVVWAGILVWAGLVLLASNLGFFEGFLGEGGIQFPGLNFAVRFEPWSVIMIGAGLLLLVGVVARLLLPEYRGDVGGNIFLAVLFIGIGLGNIFGWNLIWPLILIGLGVAVLLRGVLRSR